MGEEWRRSWHPEVIPLLRAADPGPGTEVMVVGAGPAGLEAARGLGQRGYRVTLVEARTRLGGRVDREALLPGLAAWRRVSDWRLGQLRTMPNVEIYPGSRMTGGDILDAGARHVVVATGAVWRRDGRGRTTGSPVQGHEGPGVLTPDDLLDDLVAGAWTLPTGRVVIYDDDHYVMGGLLAELAAARGHQVTLVTPAPLVSYWTQFTLEQDRIEARLRSLGVRLHARTVLRSIAADHCVAESVVDRAELVLPRDGVVLVGDRAPAIDLYESLESEPEGRRPATLRLVGDAEAPGLIAQAVFSGHRAARELGQQPTEGPGFRRERFALLAPEP
jgi:dimethylamine/trimethylamine dehydrogenase